jgi:hypothetical protein
MEVKKIFPSAFSFNGNFYLKTNKPSQIGDIVQCLGSCQYTTKDDLYPIIECYAPNGFKGIIADDGNPMGIHDNLNNFKIFRKYK